MSSAEARDDAEVLVLGASFAGIEVVLQLRRRMSRRLRVVVVDRQREHGYLPLVHERLCGHASAEGTRLPTAAFLESLPDTRFVQGEVTSLDPTTKTVTLADGTTLRARFVVVALGSVLTPPAGIEGAEHLCTYKDEPGCARTQARLQEAMQGDDAPHVVVVGGGISGVELAGELGALARDRPPRWRAPKVTLVGAQPQLVAHLGRGVGRAVRGALLAHGVEVRAGQRVVAATADHVVVESPGGAREEIACDLAIWAGGVRPAPVLDVLALPRTPAGWLAVGPTLQCFATAEPTHPDVFACGDAVRIEGGTGQWPTMQRAIECLWQAKVVARNVLALAEVAPDDPHGPPPLSPHRLRRTFFYGVSVGEKSYVVYRGLRVHVPGLTPWFRRWLMRQYFARYTPLPSTAPP